MDAEKKLTRLYEFACLTHMYIARLFRVDSQYQFCIFLFFLKLVAYKNVILYHIHFTSLCILLVVHVFDGIFICITVVGGVYSSFTSCLIPFESRVFFVLFLLAYHSMHSAVRIVAIAYFPTHIFVWMQPKKMWKENNNKYSVWYAHISWFW